MPKKSRKKATKESARIKHPVEAVYDANSRVLILGTMASPKSREMGFYYGHPQNRFWPVLEELFGQPPGSTVTSRKKFLKTFGIAMSDVISECTIEGASDASIKDPVAMDLSPIFEKADIKAVFTTGAKAAQLYKKLQKPLWPDVEHIALPSTSAANAKMRLPALVEAYSPIKELLDQTRPYWVYMARCADDTIYTGIAADVAARMEVHNSGKGAKYTRSRLPVQCVYAEKCASKGDALKREYAIKQLPRDKKEELIKANRLLGKTLGASNKNVEKSMKGNKGKNTKPELLVRERLREAGLTGYRLHWKVAGKPDIAWPGKKVAIFVQGCFWHRCPKCNPSMPRSNVEYWVVKFDRNKERDEQNLHVLQEDGWTVHTIWECELKPDVIDETFEKLLPQLREELEKDV